MEHIEYNPKGYKQKYIAHLNECFGAWGGDKEYNWVFEQQRGPFVSDLMVIHHDELGVLAGSGVTYRSLKNKSTGQQINTGIMTGSWTLPAARRRGCFSKIIQESRMLCKSHEVPHLTAFVTETNASAGRLASAGSLLVPSYHLFSPSEVYKGDFPKAKLCTASEAIKKQIFKAFTETEVDALKFEYSYETFVGQYVDRIKENTILKIGENFAILEAGTNEMKVLLMTYKNLDEAKIVLQCLTNYCIENLNKKSFLYSTQEAFYEMSLALGFESLPGYFTVLDASEAKVNNAEVYENLHIQMGDKM
ncbi:hypothetical protein [Ulvibacter antarcticus]|uniref:Acetyltransferase (GNAT) family protein n=1 Tax=Ulvibacter antarcticus TaxID=442714 RepID=A0A3L9YE17_9FLAO|nr:hypothetical protein [Ulvibacter antarcticus]RMA58956.1 hypothetical protein BXY75_2338 [Ulvibacter antarcticus]